MSQLQWNEYSWEAKKWTRWNPSVSESFCPSWWGKEERILQALNDQQFQLPASIIRLLAIPNHTGSTVILRTEVERVASRVEEAFQADCAGVVVTGQPGIGKSYYLLYQLVVCLSKRRPVLFKTRGNVSVIFTEDCIWRAEAALTSEDIPWIDDDDTRTNIWALIDSGSVVAEPEEGLVTSGVTFPVQAASPNPKRYAGWNKAVVTAATFVMDAWDDADLKRWAQLCPLFPKTSNSDTVGRSPASDEMQIQTVMDAIAVAGRCPRDIHTFLANPSRYNQQINQAIQDIQNSADIMRHLRAVARGSDWNWRSDRLFAVHRAQRVAPPRAGYIDSETMVVDFISAGVAKQFLATHSGLLLEDAVAFFRLCSTAPESSMLAGYLWEAIVPGLLCADSSIKTSFAVELNAMAMSETSGSLTGKTITFVDSTLVHWQGVRPHTILCYTDEGVDKMDPSDNMIPALPTPAPSIARLPLRQRAIQSYDNVTNITPNPRYYFVSAKSNDNPLYDAFFFDIPIASEGPVRVVLWLFHWQHTTAPMHDLGASAKALESITTLQNNAKKAGRTLEINYVLVVPQRDGVVAGWRFPKTLMDDVLSSGSVYVQYIAFDSATSALLAAADNYVPTPLS